MDGAGAAVKAQALSRSADGHRMNKLEAEWAQLLEIDRRSMTRHEGAVASWRFEPLSLRLGTGSWYKPDFMVVLEDRTVEFHETKGGFIREAALVRIKVAAHGYPEFTFRLIKKLPKKDGGGWKTKEMKP